MDNAGLPCFMGDLDVLGKTILKRFENDKMSKVLREDQ